ncbi:collagen alpha-5(VI) chain-like isoform X1 [Biomphalaria pfeifferi]|uniref:Collagen alpha-5(VI) chain-like isoform X1 n=1 Tax=Biomphalaria pfeifferi TaxID=112525 RepID=A0AAD8BN31_BIOPF|nr:collagen alpha-5(VI) chain-like isoform X1 [Biomphalaria pfeifferi]
MKQLVRFFCLFSALVGQIGYASQGPIDLVFVVDGSAELKLYFPLAIKSVVEYLFEINIGPNKTHAGVVLFSTEVSDFVPLMSDAEVLKTRVSDFTFPAQKRATNVGIRKAVDILTKAKRNVSQKMILISSGKSENRLKTKLESELAQAKGIDIWGLGIFPYLSMTELESLTTNGPRQAFEIENVREFFGAFTQLTTGETDNVYTYREPVDLVFAIDVSTKTGESNFQRIMATVLKCLQVLFIGPSDTHVGVVVSTSTPFIQLQSDYETIYSSVSSLKLSNRVLTTDKVLGAAIDSVLAIERQVPKIIILITDGDYINTYENETQSEALRARDQNINLWGVGIGCEFLLMEDLCRISQALYLKDLTTNLQTLEYSRTVVTNGR